MDMFGQIITRITNEAQQSSNHQIANQAKSIKEPTTIESFKSNLLEDYLQLLSNCLSSKNSKLRALAVNGYEAIIRDNSLWRPDICENHFFNQIIGSIGNSITKLSEITQVELLKCLLEVTCLRISHLRSTDLDSVSDICCKIIASAASSETGIGSSVSSVVVVSPKITAATATAIQSYRYFVEYLLTESSIELKDSVGHQIIPVLDSLCDRIVELRKQYHQLGKDKSSRAQVNAISSQIAFYLKCITSILIPLEVNDKTAKDLSDFVWQRLGPTLIKLLSSNMNRIKSPKKDKKPRSSKESKLYGRGSECLAINDRDAVQLREVYCVSRELVRLFGPIKSMRPVLEALFHRMLLYPLIHFRLEALQSVKELFKDSQLVAKLCTTIVSSTELSCSNQDLNLIKIIIDSLLECSSTNDQEIVHQSVYCIISLIETLDLIASGKSYSNQNFTCVLELNQSSGGDDDDGGNQNEKPQLNYDSNCDDEDDTNDSEKSNIGGQMYNKFTQEEILQDDLVGMEISSYKTRLKEIIKKSQGDDQIDNYQEFDAVDEDDGTASDEIFLTDEGASMKQSTSSNSSQFGVDDVNCDGNEKTEANHEQTDEKYNNGNTDNQFTDLRVKIINEIREENERHQTILNNHDSLSYQERENARDFAKELKAFLAELLLMKNSVQIDDALQKFASRFCKKIWERKQDSPLDILIINGDGIYLAIYSTLSLNLKLIKNGYYKLPKTSKPPITEQQFICDIYNSGVLVYLSSTWLAELYQQILTNNLLENAGYIYPSANSSALINMIRDIDGGERDIPGSHELSDYRKLTQTSSQFNVTSNAGQIIGQTITKRLLETFWDSIVKIMESVFKNDTNSSSKVSPFSLLLNNLDSEKDNAERRAILIQCLSSLQTASKLCISLGLQSRCHEVFYLLSRSIIFDPDKWHENHIEIKKEGKGFTARPSISLHTSQVLSLRSMLVSGLQIATHCEPCWDYILQSCAFISELENEYYSSKVKKHFKDRLPSFLKPKKQPIDPMNDLAFSGTQYELSSPLLGLESESDINKYLDQCIESVMHEKNGKKEDGILRDTLLERSLECLSHLSDRLFTEATSRLNLKSLLAFFEALIANSSRQINAISKKRNKPASVLLFTRFCEVLLRISKSGRPLVHFMRCWGLAVPHLIEASCCKKLDQNICKSAVSATNDIISTVLAIHTELDYFNFNEALFIPYEKILLLELCDGDIQEMIVSSICGFVEGSREDIKSGWRSLFAALRGVELPELSTPALQSIEEPSEFRIERVRQLRVILDIFEAFLNTKNLEIFPSAALDCLLCLLGLMKDPLSGEPESSIPESFEDAVIEPNETVDLCLLSLKYLHQFESMLRSMYTMPTCPFFISSRRITLSEDPKVIEIPKDWASEGTFNLSAPIKLSDFDKPSRILNVWFTLIDGIFNCINRCPKIRQSKTIETCMAILGTLRSSPGNQFAIYCINHVALPFLQKWTHEINNQGSSNISPASLTNFKHFFGLIAHLVVQHIKLWHEDRSLLGCDLMITQTVVTLIEATNSSYHEAISNLASSCFSHVIMETYIFYDDTKWNIVSSAFYLLHRTCLSSLIKLIDGFPNRSLDFYHDLEKIRVVALKVQTMPKAELITKGLAQEVFLLDCQKTKETVEIEANFSETEKYFIFEVITDENYQLEIPFRGLIRELNKHSTLIKLVGSILLSDKPYSLSPVSYFIEFKEARDNLNSTKISREFIYSSIELLTESYRIFHEFDTRLGLKLVIQKMARLHVPANLYKQAALCFGISYLACFNIILSDECESLPKAEANLKKIFEKMCKHYTDFIVQTQQENGKLDALMSNPIFLFPESFNLSSEESSEDLVDKPSSLAGSVESNHENSENEINKLDEEKEYRNYIVMSKNRIDGVMKDYRKWKSQHSPIPPSFNETRTSKSQLPKRFRTTQEEGQKIREDDDLVKDTEAYETLFSQIFISIFQSILSLNDTHFWKIMPLINDGVENLIIYSHSKELRSILALLYRRCAQKR